jgi:hypothetical protein
VSEDSSRRDFLRILGRRAAKDAREVAQAAGPVLRATSPLGGVSALNSLRVAFETNEAHEAVAGMTDDDGPEDRIAALAPTACLDADDVRQLALAEDVDPDTATRIASLARISVRMTPVIDPAQAQAWIDPVGTLGLAEAREEHILMLQVDCSAPALADTPLAGRGWLVVFVESASMDTGVDLAVPARRTSIVFLGQAAGLVPDARPMALGAELLLPRANTAAVLDLDLGDEGTGAYLRVRERLAHLQGVEPEHGAGTAVAYHRLLGFPDETVGTMPGDCVAVAGDGDWDLLAQVSVGERWRAYTWLRRDDPADTAATFIR